MYLWVEKEMKYSIPSWMKELTDQVNRTGGEGMPGVLQNFGLINRAGRLLSQEPFLTDFSELVERHEAELSERQVQTEGLSALSYPKLTGSGSKNWRKQLHTWMQTILDAFLGFSVEVPEPPALNRTQRRALKKYGFMVLYVPALDEIRYPEHMIRSAWGQYFIERIPLSGQWVAFEMIVKPDYSDVYPSDQLMADIGIKTRFAHPHSGKGEGDDIVDILPKIARKLSLKDGQQVQLSTAETWNFVANLFNWLTANTALTLPDLGSTLSWEWTANCYGSRYRVIVGDCADGGLADVHSCWRSYRNDRVGFRVLVDL